LNFCFLLIFSWKKIATEFCILGHLQSIRCLNSKEIKQQNSIKVICTSFRSGFFQLKIKKKTKIQNLTTISIFDTSNMPWSAQKTKSGWLCKYLKSVKTPATEFKVTSLSVEWKKFHINFTRWFENGWWIP
jgi:hypothetical protein